MSGHITQATRDTCDIYRDAIAAGEAQASIIKHLASQYDVQRPAIWKRLRAGGLIPDYGVSDGKPVGRLAGGVMVDREKRPNAPPPVFRDPCQRCGARGDYSCGHSKTPLGTVL
jgi:hypothetical protein